MNEQEIISALNKCSTGADGGCRDCPAYIGNARCISNLEKAALECIKRQRLEIELLLKEVEYLRKKGEKPI